MGKVLEVKSYVFAIDLAVLASSRNLLALDKWLQNRIAAGQDIFVRTCLDYLSERAVGNTHQGKPLPVETVAIFLQVLLGRYIPATVAIVSTMPCLYVLFKFCSQQFTKNGMNSHYIK